VYLCLYHTIGCPKYRKKVRVGDIEQRLKEIIRRVAEEQVGVEIIELEVMPDPVQLLCEVDPQTGADKLVKMLKGRRLCLLKQEYPKLRMGKPSLRTNSYLIETVGGAPIEVHKS
jgi:putative transposase